MYNRNTTLHYPHADSALTVGDTNVLWLYLSIFYFNHSSSTVPRLLVICLFLVNLSNCLTIRSCVSKSIIYEVTADMK